MIESSQLVSICAQCQSRFLGQGTLCRGCIDRPLLDHREDRLISRFDSKDIYEFMGWKFKHSTVLSKGCHVTILTSYKGLFNPFPPNAQIAISTFIGEKSDVSYSVNMKRAAAWLIAHWWEHYLNICPCLTSGSDHEEETNFSKAVINSLLWYDQ